MHGIKANDPSLTQYKTIIVPEAKGDKVVTLNQTGYMKIELDDFSKSFIQDAKNAKLPVLEIGAAYGITSLQALKQGATVIANDISKEHLVAISQSAPENLKNNLYLNHGRFPDQTNFPEGSLELVLACRICHFLNSEDMDIALSKIYKWLAPGGKMYFVSLSPYHHLLEKDFLPIYQQKLAGGEVWPGIVDNMKEYNPQEKEDIPDMLHVFEQEAMSRILLKHGFEIEEIRLFDYSNNSSDGKGYLGFIAKKP